MIRDPGSAACLSACPLGSQTGQAGRNRQLPHSLVRIIFQRFRASWRAARGAPGWRWLDIAPPVKRAFIQRMIFGGELVTEGCNNGV